MFSLGRLVATPGALELSQQGLDLLDLLERHASGDWGDLGKSDIDENNLSVKRGYRILSSYDTDFGKIWIITEADRSVTTFLLPAEY